MNAPMAGVLCCDLVVLNAHYHLVRREA
jgi:hypothetical protein